MAESGSQFAGCPVLKIDQSDVAPSYRLWKTKFSIYLSIKESAAKLGDAMKKLTLLSAVGNDGLVLLTAKGEDPLSGTMSYEGILATLDEHFGQEVSSYLKFNEFVTVSQLASESYRDYLLRVERLSRGCRFSDYKAEGLRLDFCLSLAVNWLRDRALRVELMSRTDLTWDRLKETLLVLQRTKDAVERMGGIW